MTPIDIPIEFEYRIRPPAAARNRRPSDRTAALTLASYRIARRGRLWELRDGAGDLVCLTAYKKGAIEVVRRLSKVSASDSVSPL